MGGIATSESYTVGLFLGGAFTSTDVAIKITIGALNVSMDCTGELIPLIADHLGNCFDRSFACKAVTLVDLQDPPVLGSHFL